MSGDGEDYEVGYGKPPKKNQFQPGQSGCPTGRRGKGRRPETSSRLLNAVLSEFQRSIEVSEKGCVRRMSAARILIRQLMVQTGKGKAQAAKILIDLLRQAEQLKAAECQGRYHQDLDWRNISDEDAAKAYQDMITLGGTAEPKYVYGKSPSD